MKIRTRYAPSPTGRMHVGNLRTALYEWLIARHEGGDYILRIEDTDQERFVEGATEIIYRTLQAAGMDHDEGPDVGGDFGPYVQSERVKSGIYLEYAKKLIDKGEAYYCFCTQERLNSLKQNIDGKEIMVYDKHCLSIDPAEAQRRVDAGEPYVIRQNNPREGTTSFTDVLYGEISVDNVELDDMILIKSDGYPTYNFANVVDDHLMGITHVVRGNEYISSTPKYNRLYEAFGWEIPQYIHLPPVMRDEHRKLSKRDGDAFYSDFIDKGYLTEAIVNYLALVGWNPGTEQELFTMDELIKAFDVRRINKSPGIFDINKLTWFNAEYIRKMSPEAYLEKVTPWFDRVLAGKGINYPRLAQLMQDRTEIFSRVPEMVAFLGQLPDYDVELYTHKKMKTDAAVSKENLEMILPVLEGIEGWSETAIHDTVMAAIAAAGKKNGAVLWPLRIAISGQANTPGGAIEIAWLLGKEETLRRVKDGLARLS